MRVEVGFLVRRVFVPLGGELLVPRRAGYDGGGGGLEALLDLLHEIRVLFGSAEGVGQIPEAAPVPLVSGCRWM